MDVLSNIDPTSSGFSSVDPYRPSFFELIAQDQLSSLLKPAIRYVLTVLAQQNPRYLLRIVNRFDEVYALIMLAVNRHYLRTWNASFTENFYGLARRRRPGVNTQRTAASVSPQVMRQTYALNRRQINLSLLVLIGMPYLDAKLNQYWEHLGGGLIGGEEDNLFEDGGGAPGSSGPALLRPTNETRFQQRKRQFENAFRKGYPYAQVAYQLWILWYNIAYLFSRSPHWRPWLQFMRIEIRRMQGNEQPFVAGSGSRPLPSFPKFPLLFTILLMRRSVSVIFETLKYALPASIFFFKFLEWWYSPSIPRRRSGGQNEQEDTKRISPPRVLPPHPDGVVYKPLPTWRDPKLATKLADDAAVDDQAEGGVLLHNSCPLCGATPIQNPCVLSTGYAFCYTCAHSYVDKWHRCPVTLVELPGGIEQIRKVLI